MSPETARGAPLVLIVDDEPLLRMDLTAALRDHGYQTEEAADGVEALSKIRASPPELLVTDIYMSDIDGLELIRLMRTQGISIPIIAMSGDRSRYDVLKMAQKLGADATIEKPFVSMDLVDLIRRLIPRKPS